MTPSTSFGRKTATWLVGLGVLSLLVGPAASRAASGAGTTSPAAWSQGTKLCDAGKLEEGWRALAHLEKSAGNEPLPAAYWRDVLGCALKASMPAHALRAGKMLEDQKATTDADRALVEKARAAVRPPDPAAFVAPGEAWVVRKKADGKVLLASTPCGFAFTPHAEPPQLPPAQRAACSVRIFGAAHPGKSGPLQASIIVMARVAGATEKPEDYAAQVMPTWKAAKVDGLRCPGARCIGYSNTIPGIYGKDGDGVGLAIAFEREQPEFPGLALEQPLPAVKAPDASTPLGRYPGRMLFVVQLDSAASVAGPARAELQRFLSGLVVE
jgi:hypothetical protein